jgi:hypothetical protein
MITMECYKVKMLDMVVLGLNLSEYAAQSL